MALVRLAAGAALTDTRIVAIMGAQVVIVSGAARLLIFNKLLSYWRRCTLSPNQPN
jgi:hypothetical protein